MTGDERIHALEEENAHLRKQRDQLQEANTREVLARRSAQQSCAELTKTIEALLQEHTCPADVGGVCGIHGGTKA
ncbi:MAG TPA: hypothetical protein VNL91_09170 [Thermoanaerobaculia bacterium]|nr:hypothetical protein [Thermoanaerobaculia bacterium]